MINLYLENISIVIPYYQQKETLFPIIDNLLSFGFKANRILIVDDCSRDEIKEKLAAKYKDVRYLRNKINSGPAYSRNLGINKTKSKYILFIDSDLSFKSRDLSSLLTNISNYDIIFPKKNYEDGSLIGPANNWEKKYCMAAGVFLLKRKSLKKLDELFDENYFLYGEDGDFFLRCYAFGLKFKYVPKSVFNHPKKILYSEKIYYFRTKNVIYFSLKFMGIVKYHLPLFLYLSAFTLLNFFMAVLNKHIEFPPLKIQKNSSYSKKLFSRLRLLFLFLKAIIWNIKNLPVVLKKRRKIKEQSSLSVL